MALPRAHHIETLSEFNSLKFSYDSTNTHYFTGGTDTIVEGTPDILYTDIAYIKPLSCIYTHAKIYPCPVLEYDNEPTANSGNLVNSGNIKSALDNNQRVFYAVTETAGANAVKEFTIPNFPTETINGVKTPLKGTILIAQCTNADARTAQLKFKVNDGGEFPIWYNTSELSATSANTQIFGLSERRYVFAFNGTHWCWASKGYEGDTQYTAGTGLKLSSGQFSLNVPRVAKSCNSLPGKNTAIIEEYQNGSGYNLPLSNQLFHILTMEGDTNSGATQLALCLTGIGVYYRFMYNSVWQPWLRLDNPTVDATPTASSTNPVTSDGIKTAIDVAPRFYLGTCSTAGNVAIKQVDIPNFPTQLVNGVETPIVGSAIAVKFSNNDGATSTQKKIKVNSTSAYPVWYDDYEITSNSSNLLVLGKSNKYIYYVFNGTHWVWVNQGRDATDYAVTPQSLGFGYASCTTAAATAAKTASLSGYTVKAGGLVVVYFQYDVPANSTLNINSTGAKEIHFGSSRIAAGVIKAGDKCLFIYNGNYMLVAIDRWGKELQEKVSGINISETDFEALSTYEQGKLYFVYDNS